MAPKKKAVDQVEGAKAEEPPAKVAKTEAEAKVEEATEGEDVEKEKDAAKDRRKAFTDTVGFDTRDTTLNTISTNGGRVLMALTDGGLQYLVAGARADVGIKKGRYMFEVKVLEVLYPAEMGRRTTQVPVPRQHCRIGFSKQGSSLFLGETADSVCFDQDGFFIHNQKKTPCSERIIRDNVLGVLLNLDPASPNANTISLFKDGRRVSKPQPLPEDLQGQPLFPHVCFRNVTLQLHFGPEPMVPLPFKCRMLQEGAQADLQQAPSSTPKDGKYDVVFPIGLPDEGTFDWLDDFLQKNPGYVELSDRKIVEWAVSSGFYKPKPTSLMHCNDKPVFGFGVQVLDELTPRKLLQTVAPLIPRNYVVMEVKSNLMKSERKALVQRFNFPHFKKLAFVAVGEPPEALKANARAALLAEKQEKIDQEFLLLQAEREKQKILEQRQKLLFEQRKAIEDAQKKAAEEAAKKAAEEAGAMDTTEAKEGEEAKGEEKKEEAKAEEEVKKEEDAEMKEEPEEELVKATAELNEEEKGVWFATKTVLDLEPKVFALNFADFTLPDEDEGFEEIRYQWHDEVPSKDYLKNWISSKKIKTRVEELNPSDWFVTKLVEWQKLQQEWQLKQKEFRQDPVRYMAASDRAQKEKAYADKLKKEQGGETEVKEEKKEAKEEKKEEGEAAAEQTEQTEEQQQEPAAEVDLDGFTPLDISAVTDVCDIGAGEPLFANFQFEDWSLMNLRFEILLLVRAFSRDVPVEDRPGVYEAHLPYYYNRYFRKQLNTKFFGAETVPALVDMCGGALSINKDNSLLVRELTEEKLEEGLEIFVKLTEEARVERQRRIDSGDESAKLKFQVMSQQPQMGQQAWGGKGGLLGSNIGMPKAQAASYGQGGWGNQMGKSGWGKGGGYGGGFKGAGKGGWGGQGYGMPKSGGWR